TAATTTRNLRRMTNPPPRSVRIPRSGVHRVQYTAHGNRPTRGAASSSILAPTARDAFGRVGDGAGRLAAAAAIGPRRAHCAFGINARQRPTPAGATAPSREARAGADPKLLRYDTPLSDEP